MSGSGTCFAISVWSNLHDDIMTLVRLASMKPAEAKALTRRERRFWADWYLAVEDRKTMNAVQERA